MGRQKRPLPTGIRMAIMAGVRFAPPFPIVYRFNNLLLAKVNKVDAGLNEY